MSGHSKWAQIKRQKAVVDAKRGSAFTKLARAITIAAREGGSDSDANSKLRLAVERAQEANMPKDNIARAIAKAEAIEKSGSTFQLEAYGPGGVALLIDVATDNRKRSIAELRHLLSEASGSLGETGSVAWQFEHRGIITVSSVTDFDSAELAAIEAGAVDTTREDEALIVITEPTSLSDTAAKLKQQAFTISETKLATLPKQFVVVEKESSTAVSELLHALEEHDDVTEVTSNAAFPTA